MTTRSGYNFRDHVLPSVEHVGTTRGRGQKRSAMVAPCSAEVPKKTRFAPGTRDSSVDDTSKDTRECIIKRLAAELKQSAEKVAPRSRFESDDIVRSLVASIKEVTKMKEMGCVVEPGSFITLSDHVDDEFEEKKVSKKQPVAHRKNGAFIEKSMNAKLAKPSTVTPMEVPNVISEVTKAVPKNVPMAVKSEVKSEVSMRDPLFFKHPIVLEDEIEVKKVHKKQSVSHYDDHSLAAYEKPEVPITPMTPIPMEIRSEWFENTVGVTPDGEAYLTLRDGLYDTFFSKETTIDFLTNPEKHKMLSGIFLNKPPMIAPLTTGKGTFVFFVDSSLHSNTKEYSRDGMAPWHTRNMRPKSRRVAVHWSSEGVLEYHHQLPLTSTHYLVEYTARLPREMRLRKKIYYIINEKNEVYGNCMITYTYEHEGNVPEIIGKDAYRARLSRSVAPQVVHRRISNESFTTNETSPNSEASRTDSEPVNLQEMHFEDPMYYTGSNYQETYTRNFENVPELGAYNSNNEYYQSNYQMMNDGHLVTFNHSTLVDHQMAQMHSMNQKPVYSDYEKVEVVNCENYNTDYQIPVAFCQNHYYY